MHRKKRAVHKVGTRDNPADMLTKGLKRELLEEHVAFVNGHIRSKRGRPALKLNSMSVSDVWAKGGSKDGVITRIHLKPREALFTPMKVARDPKDAKAVGSLRKTIGKFEDGENIAVRDDWETSKDPHRRLRGACTGRTHF